MAPSVNFFRNFSGFPCVTGGGISSGLGRRWSSIRNILKGNIVSRTKNRDSNNSTSPLQGNISNKKRSFFSKDHSNSKDLISQLTSPNSSVKNWGDQSNVGDKRSEEISYHSSISTESKPSPNFISMRFYFEPEECNFPINEKQKEVNKIKTTEKELPLLPTNAVASTDSENQFVPNLLGVDIPRVSFSEEELDSVINGEQEEGSEGTAMSIHDSEYCSVSSNTSRQSLEYLFVDGEDPSDETNIPVHSSENGGFDNSSLLLASEGSTRQTPDIDNLIAQFPKIPLSNTNCSSNSGNELGIGDESSEDISRSSLDGLTQSQREAVLLADEQVRNVYIEAERNRKQQIFPSYLPTSTKSENISNLEQKSLLLNAIYLLGINVSHSLHQSSPYTSVPTQVNMGRRKVTERIPFRQFNVIHENNSAVSVRGEIFSGSSSSSSSLASNDGEEFITPEELEKNNQKMQDWMGNYKKESMKLNKINN